MIDKLVNGVTSLLAIKNLNTLPKWVVVVGVIGSAVYIFSARDMDNGVALDDEFYE